MGQYYKPCILDKKNKTTVLKYLYSHNYDNGLKLMEHSYIGNNFVGAFESLIAKTPQRVVWGGDYAEPCKNRKTNTYDRCNDKNEANPITPNQDKFQEKFKFIVNHTKKEFVDKTKVPEIEGWDGTKIHPLPLLTCEGNGQGGGDFRGDEKGIVGSWARDLISVESKIPKDFKEIIFDLVE